ncbi:DUF445 domain-containing protein [Jeongeupia sp. USM3]|uniref:DUF445 domain-containing protein n=1 Tax=Jeongeupia sp. USM3 TaxID=1906741 RepID=UPI00089DD92C|nr:DUF445 domain-containing protein [Jeongeupia sp. USM3]AOY01856.1 hypothetical protein BJP62_16230 [Jeongeupia sp. USM3]
MPLDDSASELYARREAEKRRRLRRARAGATGLLLSMVVLALLALFVGEGRGGWGYLAAFAEAAVVGALADWFAITALFRHPMRLPIPHTAIVPQNKVRIAESLGQFIETHFLLPEVLAKRIDAFNPARRLAVWLARPANARQLTEQGTQLFRFVLDMLDEPKLAQLVRDFAVRRLGQVDLGRRSAALLQIVRHSGQHHKLFDGIVRAALSRLDTPNAHDYVAGVIASEFNVLRWVALDEAGGRYLARKLIGATSQTLERALAEPDHPLRQAFERQLGDWIGALGHDPDTRAQLAQWQRKLLDDAGLQDGLEQLWRDALGWLRHDLERDDSQIRAKVGAAVKQFGLRLRDDTAFVDWLNARLRTFAAQSLARYRGEIGVFIADQLKGWDDKVLVDRLELNVGIDLQFIRVNGTLVGGLIGLLIYTARQFAGL